MGREREGGSGRGRWRQREGRIGRIAPVKFGEISCCCNQIVD